jgi:hypothetical protein
MKREEEAGAINEGPLDIQESDQGRRNFLRSLGKWSAAVIGAVLLGGAAPRSSASAWVNTRGSWVNGGGGGWANRGGSWANGGGGWINRGGGGGAGWINGGGGGGWINRRGY